MSYFYENLVRYFCPNIIDICQLHRHIIMDHENLLCHLNTNFFMIGVRTIYIYYL